MREGYDACMRRALSRLLLVCALPAAGLLAFACGSSEGSTFVDSDAGSDGTTTGTSSGNTASGGFDPGDSGPGTEEDANALKDNTASIAFVPTEKTLIVDGATLPSQSFDLEATLKDGTKAIVIPDAVQFDRPDLATAKITSTTTLTASGTYAGTGTLHGVYGALEATATLTVKIAKRDLNGVSEEIASALDATPASPVDAGTAADDKVTSLLYPYDKTVFALGLTSPQIMWNAPNTGDTYRFRLAQGNYTYDVYKQVGKPGRFRIDQAIWDIATASNKGAGTPLSLIVSRYDAAEKKARVSVTETFTIAPESLRGAIYYWTASLLNGVRKGHISRFRPGTGATPVALNNGKCMGCHAVNAEGTVLVGDIDDQNDGKDDPSTKPYGNWSKTRAWASFDVSKPEAPLSLKTNKFGADIALNPNGKYVVFGGPTSVDTGGSSVSNPMPGSKYFSLATVADGNVIATSGLDDVNVPAGKGMQMPAFSPDGKMLAVVVSSFNADNVIPDNKGTSIQFLGFDESKPKFDATLQMLVDGSDAVFTATTGQGLAYPSFTPDSKAVAFHVGTTPTGCTAGSKCDDTTIDDGNLFIQPIAKGGKASPIAMTNASDPPNAAEAHLSVEPTFNPQPRGGYSWVVFTSMRSWGNVPFPDGTPDGFSNGKRRLWVAAVDPTIGTVDPSHPAIYLEGQEDTPNMRGFWANAVCTATAPAGSPPSSCTAGYECCSGFCVGGACVDPSTVACTGLGGACTTAADCCNSGAVACTGGLCTPVRGPVK